jgi:hypothetical protein
VTPPTREEALAHFGVKGMHWGQRKMSEASATLKSTRPTRTKNDGTGNSTLNALKNQTDFQRFQMVKTGAKKVGAILGIVGSVVLAAAISGRGTQKI